MENHAITSQDGRKIIVRRWFASPAKATVHLMHGMAEHIDRYNAFAEFLSSQGFDVIAHNHRGHGEEQIPGHYADQQGWEKIIQDIVDVQQQAIKNRELPLILFGHSMGSFIAQGYAIRHSERIAGLILSGSNYQSPFLYHAGKLVAKIERKRLGNKGSGLLDKLSFASFNNHFKPARTEFDWLSRDQQEVDKYIADNGCGFPCSGETWHQLFDGLIEISNVTNLKRIRSDLPVYLFGGDKDPVGNMGKGLPALDHKLRQSGHNNVTLRLYKDGRHEMLNETNKQEVYQDINNWLTDTIKA